MLSKLYVDDLPQTGVLVKVVNMIPSGTVTARVPRDESTENLVRNIACETGVKCLMLFLNTKNLPQK